MAGETMVSIGSIEKRAQELEAKEAEPKAEALEGAEKSQENAPEATKAAEGKQPDKKEVVKDEKTGKFVKVAEKVEQKPPEDSKELRKWATKLSMENAEIRKQMENLAAMLTKKQAQKVDWKELAKDPAKLEKMVEQREQELIAEQKTQYQRDMEQAAAEITNLESTRRYSDAESYPRWAELMPLMKKMSDPNAPDTRINFNQHPKIVLDALYELAQEVAASDPAYKNPEPAKSAVKTFSQEEYDEAIAKAKEDALADQNRGLKSEMKGASVSGMSKGSPKGKPGEVNKEVIWNMPMDSLKSTLQRATDELHGR